MIFEYFKGLDMIKAIKYILILFTLGFIIPSIANAEIPVGSTVESRMLLAFKVNDQAAQALLPEDWRLLTLPKGPLAGANLLVVFIDKHLSRGPDGKPLDPYSSRTVAIVNYGVKAGVKGARMFVTQVYETPPVVNPYENSITATISRSASVDDAKNHKETWSIKPETGGEINFSLSYQSGKPGWKADVATPYSNKKPDFHRIYKYEQVADLLMSKALGKELTGEISFQSSVPEMAGMFDKNEQLIGVLAIPVYVRDVFLP